MNVGDLRKAIEGLPDKHPVVLVFSDGVLRKKVAMVDASARRAFFLRFADGVAFDMEDTLLIEITLPRGVKGEPDGEHADG